MPKAKPISPHPLTFDEAFQHLVRADPNKVGITPKRRNIGLRANNKTTLPPNYVFTAFNARLAE